VTIVKFLLGLVSASLLSASLVAAAPAATAAPYPNSIATFCSANGNAKVVNVRVRADGNREPRGTASIRISKGGDVVRSTSVDFNGGDYSRKVLAHRLGKGRYTVTVKANPSNDAYKNCSASFRVRVR
jgi:hypothetical protein